MSLARAAVDKLSALPAPPEEVFASAKLHLLDVIGVGIAAASTQIGAPYRRYGAGLPAGPASVLGQETRGPARDAAMVNGGLIHSLEFDDTHTGSIVHGSSVLASAALAAAQQVGSSGQAFLAAYAGWYEVLIRFGLAAAGGFQAKGYQLTSAGGALAAAGAAAEIKGLSPNACVAAIGIALSQASGVFEFLTNGSTVKSLHPGWAAHAGLVAADLAEAGLTGPESAIEGRFGLFRLFAGDEAAAGRFEQSLPTLGEKWHLLDAAYKFYPCCHYIHAFLEAVAELRKDGIEPGAVVEIVLSVPKGAAALVCESWEEKLQASGHLARWSLPVCVAMQWVDGRVDLDSFEKRPHDAVYALARRCRWQVMEGASFPARFEADVTCILGDGSRRSRRIDDVFGNATRPPERDAVLAKFRANAARLMGEAGIAAIEEAVEGLDGAADLTALTHALSGTLSGTVKA